MEANIAEKMNDQLKKELYSAYLYLSIANYYEEEGLRGFENWFYVQAQEERDHAMLFRAYLLDNEQTVRLQSIPAPAAEFQNFREPLAATLDHERAVTASIHDIYAAANGAGDYRAMQFLDWFVREQREEEKTAAELIRRYELFGKDAKGLYSLDAELGGRVYAAPPAGV